MVLQKARENQLIESGFYPGLEQIIEEYGTDYDERAAEAQAQAALVAGAGATNPDGTPKDPTDPNNAPPSPAAAANSNDPKAKPAKKSAGLPAKKTATANDQALLDMTQRIRDATTPRPLYVYRPVLNWKAIADFYKKQDGIESTLGADMHVTVIYSKKAIDWLKVGEDNFASTDKDGNLTIKPGGPRVMEQFGQALVLAFASSDLSYRHNSAEYRADASYDFDDYTPHVTITYKAGAVDVMHMPVYTGEIILGPEVFEVITPGGFDPDTNKEV
jgi:hypothetical protein